MIQNRVRLPLQAVLTKHARSLDLFEGARLLLPAPAEAGYSLPAIPAGGFQKQQGRKSAGIKSGELHAGMRALDLLHHRMRSAPRLRALSARVAPQKENQCQES